MTVLFIGENLRTIFGDKISATGVRGTMISKALI